MKVHLISYATRRYRLRQVLLGLSAKANGIASSVDSWTLPRLGASDFGKAAPDISLSERGSGFWAWKPYFIGRALDAAKPGDMVLYCDVGRYFPYVLLDQPLEPFFNWMETRGQDVLPGVKIPWTGPMRVWTKRDAFVGTNMDRPEIHEASPIQAAFSFWRVTPECKDFVNEWLSWCVRRDLISDDTSTCGLPELPGFRGHRHDQSLLTLCCLKRGLDAMDIGGTKPSYNERDPGEVAKHLTRSPHSPTLSGKLLRLASKPLEFAEKTLRERVTFGKTYERS